MQPQSAIMPDQEDRLRDLLSPRLVERPLDLAIYEAAVTRGVHPLAARVLARRDLPLAASAFDLDMVISPSLGNLDSPWLMMDMDRAAERVAQAVLDGHFIAVETDFDADGQTSNAVLRKAMTSHFGVPESRVGAYISQRLTEGYGLTDPVVDRVLADQKVHGLPVLVITADNGSSDELRIARLKAGGIDVIVSDHHAIPEEGIPASAYAVVNPTRSDCDFPDKTIAGCMVAWLLMSATRAKLMKLGHLPADCPKLVDLLSFVAVGTVADCVSLASKNNRALVNAGLALINRSDAAPPWQVIRQYVQGSYLTPEDLGFKVGPMLNAASRVANVTEGVSFLLSETEEEATRWAELLNKANETRKGIERGIVLRAIAQVEPQVLEGRLSVIAHDDDFHAGVIGICASRLKDRTGRPAIVFASPDDKPELLTGSARGVDYQDFHVREALQWVADRNPGLMVKFGGHKGAAGLTIRKADLNLFRESFESAVAEQITVAEPVIQTDGDLTDFTINEDLYKVLNNLAPYGQKFRKPVFTIVAKAVSVEAKGADGTHIRSRLETSSGVIDAMWFGGRRSNTDPLPLLPGQRYRMAVTIDLNEWMGRRTVQLIVEGAEFA